MLFAGPGMTFSSRCTVSLALCIPNSLPSTSLLPLSLSLSLSLSPCSLNVDIMPLLIPRILEDCNIPQDLTRCIAMTTKRFMISGHSSNFTYQVSSTGLNVTKILKQISHILCSLHCDTFVFEQGRHYDTIM